jgi:hypothetical protein
VSNILKYGSLNLLESSGPVQACNGIALHDLYRHNILERTLEFGSVILLTETRRNDDGDENDKGSDDDDDDTCWGEPEQQQLLTNHSLLPSSNQNVLITCT